MNPNHEKYLTEGENGWKEYKRFVITKLEEHDQRFSQLEQKIDVANEQRTFNYDDLLKKQHKTEVNHKTLAAKMAGVASTVSVLVSAIITYLLSIWLGK